MGHLRRLAALLLLLAARPAAAQPATQDDFVREAQRSNGITCMNRESPTAIVHLVWDAEPGRP